MKQVHRFKSLGSTITEDIRSESDIKQRIGIARNVFGKTKKKYSNRHVRKATWLRVIKTYGLHYFMDVKHGPLPQRTRSGWRLLRYGAGGGC